MGKRHGEQGGMGMEEGDGEVEGWVSLSRGIVEVIG